MRLGCNYLYCNDLVGLLRGFLETGTAGLQPPTGPTLGGPGCTPGMHDAGLDTIVIVSMSSARLCQGP